MENATTTNTANVKGVNHRYILI